MFEDHKDRVISIAEQVNEVLVGHDIDEARTAMTIVIGSAIVGLVRPELWDEAAERFHRSVLSLLHRPEVVSWIRESLLKGRARELH